MLNTKAWLGSERQGNEAYRWKYPMLERERESYQIATTAQVSVNDVYSFTGAFELFDETFIAYRESQAHISNKPFYFKFNCFFHSIFWWIQILFIASILHGEQSK